MIKMKENLENKMGKKLLLSILKWGTELGKQKTVKTKRRLTFFRLLCCQVPYSYL